MKTKAISKGLLFDNVEINPSPNSEFFKDKEISPEKFNPVTTISESDISNWLLKTDSVRNLIFDELKISATAKFETTVQEPFIKDPKSKPGDIDILVCDSKFPTHSVAFECKRIKVKPEAFFTDQIGGLGKAKYAVEQVNALAKNFSFSQIYLLLIIEVNGKNRTKFNQFCRGTTQMQKERIYKLPLDKGIDSKIGVIFVEIVQVTNQSFDKNGYVGLSIGRLATKRNQLSELTEKLHRYFK